MTGLRYWLERRYPDSPLLGYSLPASGRGARRLRIEVLRIALYDQGASVGDLRLLEKRWLEFAGGSE